MDEDQVNTGDEAGADAVEAAFYHAFEALDANAMRALWDDDALCVHPGGPLLQGKSAVVQSWAEIFASADPPRIAYRVIHRMHTAELSVHLVEERIHPNGKGSAKPALVLATNSYRRGPGGWRLCAHHASLPLVLSEPVRDPTQLH